MPDHSETLDSRLISLRGFNRQRIAATATVLGIVLLIALQWRSWQSFDWSTFVSEIRGLHWPLLAVAVALSLLTVPLKAWRWQVFLRPVRDANFADVFAPTVIGFTGLALMGRPGELLRPYMIAKRTRLTMASQMGVWTVERLFDMGAFAIMAVIAFLFASRLPDLRPFQTAAYLTTAVTLSATIAAIVACRWHQAIFSRLGGRFATDSRPGALLCKAQAFAEGLNTIKDGRSLIELWLLSFAIWTITAFSYVATLSAYPILGRASMFTAILLMGCSMIGGLVQLPAVGGGAQLATIAAMVSIFGFPRELAVSAGILLWLVSFHAVTPFGLLMARREHFSMLFTGRKLNQERPGSDSLERAPLPTETAAALVQCESEG